MEENSEIRFENRKSYAKIKDEKIFQFGIIMRAGENKLTVRDYYSGKRRIVKVKKDSKGTEYFNIRIKRWKITVNAYQNEVL